MQSNSTINFVKLKIRIRELYYHLSYTGDPGTARTICYGSVSRTKKYTIKPLTQLSGLRKNLLTPFQRRIKIVAKFIFRLLIIICSKSS